MKTIVWIGMCGLYALAFGCAPSKDVESPADPPGIEREDEKAEQRANAEPEPQPENAQPESESGE